MFATMMVQVWRVWARGGGEEEEGEGGLVAGGGEEDAEEEDEEEEGRAKRSPGMKRPVKVWASRKRSWPRLS